MDLKSFKNAAIEIKKGFRVSHLIYLCIGVLIPIYADVLFLHEFNSSTVSAIMDTVMAIAAVSAALSVRNWLKDRMKNKGFEQADICVKQLANLKHKAKTTLETIQATINQSKDLDNALSDDWYFEHTEKARLLVYDFHQSYLDLCLQLDLLTLYNIMINSDIDDSFELYLENLRKFSSISDNMIGAMNNGERIKRNEFWYKNRQQFHECYENIKTTHFDITVPFDKLFTYIEKRLTVTN